MGQHDYDVVVIGGGMGGLSAAGFLTKSGIKTLLVEKLPFLGGRGSSLEYKGYQISTGAGAFGLGIEENIYRPLGASFKVRVPKTNSVYWINNQWRDLPEKGKLRAAMTIAAGEEDANNVMKIIRMLFFNMFLPLTIRIYKDSEKFDGNGFVLWVVRSLCQLQFSGSAVFAFVGC